MGWRTTRSTFVRAILACLVSIVMVVSFIPTAAFADSEDNYSASIDDGILVIEEDLSDEGAEEVAVVNEIDVLNEVVDVVPLDVDGTYAGENGWVLEYSASDEDEITITGIAQEGTGTLVIPASIDGMPVTTFGYEAFRGCSALKTIDIPDSVTELGLRTFFASGLESVTIPATVQRVPYYCFGRCESLTEVNFESDTLRYLSQASFYSCSALESIEIPLLTSSPTLEEARADGLNDTSADYGASVGARCFYDCTSLREIIFDGPVVQNPTTYFASWNCIYNCASDLQIVCKCATVNIPSGTGNAAILSTGSLCYTLDFYDSLEAAASESYSDAGYMGSATYEAVSRSLNTSGQLRSAYPIQVFPLLYGTKDYSAYLYDGNVPACPEGKVWGIVSRSLNAYSYMSGCYQVAAVDPDDLTYGWVSSPSIAAFQSTSTNVTGTGMMNDDEGYAEIYMEADGTIPELAQIAAYSSDSNPLDPSKYTLVFEKATFEYEMGANGMRQTITNWDEIAFEDIVDAGTYRVRAIGTGDYAESETDTVRFEIIKPKPSVITYYDSNISKHLGTVAYDTTNYLKSVPSFDVIVPATDWHNQLLGDAFAGAGRGVLITDCGASYSATMMNAFLLAGTDSYIMLGSQQDVPQSTNTKDEKYLADLVDENAKNSTRYGADATTAQELSHAAISTFRPDRWNAAWGDVAVVASSTEELISVASAQYIYHNAARTIFLNDDGTIADEDLTLLEESGVSQIVLVGDTSCVSNSVATSIASATGITPTRILEGATASEASLELAYQMVNDGCSWRNVVIADASNPTNVTNAAILAESLGGVLLTCRTSADAKAIEAAMEGLIADNGLSIVDYFLLVGGFSYLEDPAECFSSAWDVTFSDLNTTGSITLEVGDTFEVNGIVYRVTSGSTVDVAGVTGSASSADAPVRITYANVTYTVAGVDLNTMTVYAGTDRYATANLISSAVAEEEPYAGVIVCSGQNGKFADALCASGLSGVLNYPVVLTNGSASSLDSETASTVSSLLGGTQGNIVVLGGTSTVSAGIASGLGTYGNVTRVSGDDRYATAEAVYTYGSNHGGWSTEYAVVAIGNNFPDALGAASFCTTNKVPMLLTDQNSANLESYVKSATEKASGVVIVGGETSISAGKEQALGNNTVRMNGADRYATNLKFAEWQLDHGMTIEGAGIATGTSFPDSLGSSYLLSLTKSVLLLTSQDEAANASLYTLLNESASGITNLSVFGGENSVYSKTKTSIIHALGNEWETVNR